MNFKSFLESSESHLIQHLGNQLKQFNNKNYSILGHGTSNKTIAEKISQEGIKYHSPDLNRQALSLFDQNKLIQNQYDNLNTILNWPHKNSKFIVLIGIPNAPQHMRGGMPTSTPSGTKFQIINYQHSPPINIPSHQNIS